MGTRLSYWYGWHGVPATRWSAQQTLLGSYGASFSEPQWDPMAVRKKNKPCPLTPQNAVGFYSKPSRTRAIHSATLSQQVQEQTQSIGRAAERLVDESGGGPVHADSVVR